MEKNRAFLVGDAVSVYFFVRNRKLIMEEECYFFLMASMRKMRMNIPISFTLEYFTAILEKKITDEELQNAFIHFIIYRNDDDLPLTKSPVNFFISSRLTDDVLNINTHTIEMDLLKEISINTSLLNNILTHSPENIYAEIYAGENDLDEVILLNPHKRIARAISGNLLFLEGDTIRIPKQNEGAYMSPLMENLVTFIHKNKLAEIEQAEMNPFESQKANEILLVSDQKGLFYVSKIRNKIFGNQKFKEITNLWRENFNKI